jgi:predicted nucleic acid-binding protein
MTGASFDSGVLVKAYCREQNSPEAIALVLAQAPPLPLGHLQEAEVRHTLRLKVFRQEMTSATLRGALALLDDDIRAGRLERPRYEEGAVYRRAESLSSRHTATTGVWMPDILHIAVALEIKAPCFVSFDARQRAVAKKAGLKVLPKTT